MNKMGAGLRMEGMQVCVCKYSYVIHHHNHNSLSWSTLWGPTSFCTCKEQQSTLRLLLYPLFLSKYIQALRACSLQPCCGLKSTSSVLWQLCCVILGKPLNLSEPPFFFSSMAIPQGYCVDDLE